jgi:hypothetical protein
MDTKRTLLNRGIRSRFVLSLLLATVCAAACTARNPPPPTPTSGVSLESCDCRFCGCPDTGNMCTHWQCELHFGSYGCYGPNLSQTTPYPWLDSRTCNDNAAHHGNGYYCIVSGRCDQAGSCSPYVGSGNEYYTCDQNGGCTTCECSYSESTGVYGCCSQSNAQCMNTPSCTSPPAPSCGNGVNTPDNYCTLNHHC